MSIFIVFLFYFSTTKTSIHVNMNSVPVLNEANFKDWNENMESVLDHIDLNLLLRMKQPPSPTESSTFE